MRCAVVVSFALANFLLSAAAVTSSLPSLVQDLRPVAANLTPMSVETPGLQCFTFRSPGISGYLSSCEDPVHDVCAPPTINTSSECYTHRLFGRGAEYRTPLNWQSSRPTKAGLVCRVEFLKRNLRVQTPILFSFKEIQETAQDIIETCNHAGQRRGGISWIRNTGYYVQVVMDHA